MNAGILECLLALEGLVWLIGSIAMGCDYHDVRKLDAPERRNRSRMFFLTILLGWAWPLVLVGLVFYGIGCGLKPAGSFIKDAVTDALPEPKKEPSREAGSLSIAEDKSGSLALTKKS